MSIQYMCFFNFATLKMIYVMVNENEWDMMMSMAKIAVNSIDKLLSYSD